jgi:uncharacterized membrane protein YagU involved in acid resistance
MRKIVAGSVAGFAATIPMSAAMIAMHKQLSPQHRHSLPPRKITVRVASAMGLHHRMNSPQRDAAAIAAHFGYGTAMGGIFAALAPRVPAPSVFTGIGWGLFVWAVSYLGLLPALGLHEPATRHPRQRNILMIVAHIIWGGALGALMKWHESVRRSPRRLQMGGPERAARPHLLRSHC